MYFCQDVDLMAWEPGIFLEASFAHQTLFKSVVATLTGTTLSVASGSLAEIQPGMVVQVTLSDGSATQMLEVTSVTDTTHVVVSGLRGRNSETALTPFLSGSVKFTLVTFQPQIAAVGDDLLSLVGVSSDRGTAPAPAYNCPLGFKPATIFGTLAAIYRTLADTKAATNVTYNKRAFYEGLAQAARQTIAATVDQDGDGIPETRVLSGVHTLVRT